jgi:BirA family biotin operon repressor/biotin-[acetyl-CoA-carboxylase] ligase
MEVPDLLLPLQILPHLEKARRFVRPFIEHHRQIASTNDRARELAHLGYGEGTLVVAESQQAGRGRLGRSWASPPGGGVYFSLILRPRALPSAAPGITLLAGVAACDAVRAVSGAEPRIKWPNDLLIGSRKVAGILTEMEADRGRIHHVVLGIGINANTRPAEFPPDLVDRATSLLTETSTPVCRAELLGRVILEIENRYDAFLRGQFQSVLEAWRSRSATLGREVRVEAGGRTVVGEAQDVDLDGALLVRGENGVVHRVSFGEVTHLRTKESAPAAQGEAGPALGLSKERPA